MMPRPESRDDDEELVAEPVDTDVDPVLGALIGRRIGVPDDVRHSLRDAEPNVRDDPVVVGPARDDLAHRPPRVTDALRGDGSENASRAIGSLLSHGTWTVGSTRGVFHGPPLIVVCPSARHVNGLPRVATTPVRGRHRDRDTRRSSDQAALAWICGARMGGAGLEPAATCV